MRNTTLLILLILSASLKAQTISTEAPSATASAVTVSKGVFQLESRLQLTDTKSARLYDASHLFRIGVSDRLELRATNGAFIQEYKGFNQAAEFSLSNIWLGAKFGIINNPEKKTKMALIAHFELPDPEMRAFYSIATLAVSHAINANNSIAYSAVLAYRTYKSYYDYNRIGGTLMYASKLNAKLGVFGEIYGSVWESNIDVLKNQGEELNFDTGLTYLLRDNIQLDYTFGYGTLNRMYFHAVGFNLMILPDKKD